MPRYYNKDKRKNSHEELSYEGKYLVDPKYMTKRDLQFYYRYYNMTKNRSQFKKIIVIIFCVCFFSYIFVDYNIKTKLIRLRDRFDFVPRIDAKYNVSQAYFVNTPGCRMPYFDVTDEVVVQYMYKPKDYTCLRALTRTSDVGHQLLLNMDETELLERYNVSSLAQVRCTYAELRRINDTANEYMTPVPFRLKRNSNNTEFAVPIPVDVEFISVECMSRARMRNFYRDFHFFAVNKTQVPLATAESERSDRSGKREHEKSSGRTENSHRSSVNESEKKTADATESCEKKTLQRVSVMVLGIDSVSHLNFLRQMPRTAAYIHNKLSHVEFWGYNKVGDNTYPNLMPVLSGLDLTELNISCLASVKQAYYDKCAFIWKRYKDAGFRTAYAEDVATLGLFNYLRPGFRQQPTDYYLRPVLHAMERHISYHTRENMQLCKGGRRTVDVLLEFIRKLLPYLQAEHFFSFFWTVTITHDLFNMAALLDDDILQLFQLFEAAGVFNKTVIFLLSDHGLRWGSFRSTYQGMMEERQPLLMALYPPWFRQQHAQAIANMELNARRLTTHFDMHATLLDLIDLRKLQPDELASRTVELADTSVPLPRGISLFLPVPDTRTCEQAGIAAHWCTCHQSQELQTNDARVQRAARYIVKLINDSLKSHPQCRVLYLNSIKQALLAAPHNNIVKDITNDYSIDVTLRIQTKPGLGEFESTVRMSGYSIALTGTISRLNLYGSQSYCIDDYSLKMFCYCHR